MTLHERVRRAKNKVRTRKSFPYGKLTCHDRTAVAMKTVVWRDPNTGDSFVLGAVDNAAIWRFLNRLEQAPGTGNFDSFGEELFQSVVVVGEPGKEKE